MPRRKCLTAIFGLCLLAARVAGQTTQPAPTAWEEAVAGAIKVLTEECEDPVFNAAVPEEAIVQRFGLNEANSRVQLRQRSTGLSVVGSHAYSWPTESIASDLAADVKTHPTIAESIRKQFLTRDDAEARKANTIAQQWVSGLLKPAPGQVVAVILLCEPPPSLTTTLLVGGTIQTAPPLFVLLKGQKTEEGQFRITHVSYGDARQALN